MKHPLVLLATAGCLTLTSMPEAMAAKPGSWRGQSVTEFSSKENESMNWQVVVDGVMGGLSEGALEFADGNMQFSGTLSLANNGGFSSVRTGAIDYNLSNDLGLLMLVKGDGRTYQARLESDARYRNWAVSFSGEFETVAGKWQQVKVPFSAFRGGFRGRDLPEAQLDPSQIRRLGIILADKNPGSFELEVAWIRTYGKGQGNYVDRSVQSGKEAPKSLIETAVQDGRFSTFKKALDAAGLTVFFQWDNPLTVLAPTDAAFAKLPAGTLDSLLQPENKQKLIELLSYHVSAGNHTLDSALESGSLEPVRGERLTVAFAEGRVRINEATLLEADLRCQDGMLHAINDVLIPPGF